MANPLQQPKTPTRFPSGVGTRKAPDPLANYPAPDPSDTHTHFNDFDFYTAAQWTATITGTGTAALAAGDGGVLALTTSANSGDNVFVQKTIEGFLLELGRRSWFKVRLKVDALTCQVVAGLQITNTTPLNPAQGMFLMSAAGGQVTAFSRFNLSTGSTNDRAANSTAVGAQLAANTYTDLAFYWNGKSEVSVYQDGKQVSSFPVDGLNNQFLPNSTTTITLGVQTTTAAARTLSVDYFTAAKARR